LVLMKFVIIGNGKVQDVGARPMIYVLANKNGVKVFPRNIPRNKIEVIVEGQKASINAFWKCVKKADIQQIKNPGSNSPCEVGELEDYGGPAPDFTYFAGSTTMEQVSKGTHVLSSIDSKLASLPGDIAKALRESKEE